MGLTIIVSLSPREDKQKRGFIPCSEQLADSISLCNGKIWCASKAIINNIAEACEKIYSTQIQKYRAENIIERIIEQKERIAADFDEDFSKFANAKSIHLH